MLAFLIVVWLLVMAGVITFYKNKNALTDTWRGLKSMYHEALGEYSGSSRRSKKLDVSCPKCDYHECQLIDAHNDVYQCSCCNAVFQKREKTFAERDAEMDAEIRARINNINNSVKTISVKKIIGRKISLEKIVSDDTDYPKTIKISRSPRNRISL